MRTILATTALVFLTACAFDAPKSCGWDQGIYPGDTECVREGNGDGPSGPEPAAAPEPASEPAPEPPEPVDAPVAAPDPEPAPAARPEPVTPASVPDKPEPEEPVDPEPEPEKPQYSDWAQPGDEAIFDTDEYTDDEIDMKKMELAARRAQAEADHEAQFGGDKAGGFNR